jgi:hypothetical protein
VSDAARKLFIVGYYIARSKNVKKKLRKIRRNPVENIPGGAPAFPVSIHPLFFSILKV